MKHMQEEETLAIKLKYVWLHKIIFRYIISFRQKFIIGGQYGANRIGVNLNYILPPQLFHSLKVSHKLAGHAI